MTATTDCCACNDGASPPVQGGEPGKCYDTDHGLLDANNLSCADYAINGYTSSTDCGPNDGTSGFDSMAMCCSCLTGGTTPGGDSTVY